MQLKNKWLHLLMASFTCVAVFTACNKEYEFVDPTSPFVSTGPATGTAPVSSLITSDTTFSYLRLAATKAGLTGLLGNAATSVTLFAPDNAAFRRSFALMGLPQDSTTIANILDAATLKSILSYHVIPGVVTAESIPDTFPNVQYPTFLNPAPQLSPLLRLTIFPSKKNGAFVNNIPIIAPGVMASNGIIYRVAGIVAPPSKTLYEFVATDTTLSYLAAAMARADSGRTTIADTSLIEISKSIGANLTVFAPVNNAFRQFLAGMGLPQSPAVFNGLPVNTVRGLIAYHILGYRAFSVNMPKEPSFVKTMLNAKLPAAHPGINVVAGFTGPFVVTSFKVTGVGNGGNAANVVAQDIHAVNGVIHKIDRVLLPQ